MPPPRVAWVASAGTLQMLGQVLRPQAIALIDEMVELTAICPLGAETTELPTPPLEIIHYRPGRGWALHPSALAALAGEIKKRKIKLLHALQIESLPLTAHLAKAAGVSYVVSSYSPADAQRFCKLGAKAAAVLAASKTVYDELTRRKAIGHERIHLVRPGVIQVDRPVCFHDSSHSVTIAAGGNMDNFAAFDAVLKSLAELLRRDYDCVCFIVGVGRAERRLRAQAEKLGLLNRLTFAGDQPGSILAGIFQDADIYICAAAGRTVELQSLLAMAAGIPVLIAGDQAGDFILDGKTALRFLVSSSNVLTGKLTSLLDDHQAAAAMVQRALSHLRKNHSAADAAAATAKIYRQAQQEAS